MIRLIHQDYLLLGNLARNQLGQHLVELLKELLDQTNTQLRTASAEQLGWTQGQAQCLADLIDSFERAEELAQKTQPRT